MSGSGGGPRLPDTREDEIEDNRKAMKIPCARDEGEVPVRYDTRVACNQRFPRSKRIPGSSTRKYSRCTRICVCLVCFLFRILLECLILVHKSTSVFVGKESGESNSAITYGCTEYFCVQVSSYPVQG